MITEEHVQVTAIKEMTEDVLKLETNGGIGRALLYRKLHPDVTTGDWVIINTTATQLNLGTGGWDIVRAVINKTTQESAIKEKHGHIMKNRYLSDQHSVMAVESEESPTHHLFKKKLNLKDQTVFLCELHSMLPIIWYLLKIKSEHKPLAVIFSDEASLPLSMSNHLARLKKEPLFFSITTGQSFGGNKESINVVTSLQYIMEMFADPFILITLGPGVVGTGTHYGFSSISQANWANVVGALGGTPVWIPRLSAVDQRERHQGISHHTMTPLIELTLTNSILPLPKGEYAEKYIRAHIDLLRKYPHIKITTVDEKLLFPLLEIVQRASPFPLTTMGRTIDKDPLFFLGVAAAVCTFLE
ncbi:DUF3866 family protein [Evansella cellulosilytica]|uniref:DUF3866 family protein n=1 Tax=Evansella cellulosilytica (strain ATCC 21833 / DSM 2522 / FERM P-1141 / JCM 9156 / N-4) TaxID=649639 RepID=E6TYJ2_EVAC2|nr:DUF3866 family protein [Evansella cellulosilytica]ADU30042.1 hypothetical protein Bcell_1780 [Evansella cellulosilytica DSM 2522]